MFDFNFFINNKIYLSRKKIFLIILLVSLFFSLLFLGLNIRKEIDTINTVVYTEDNIKKLKEIKILEEKVEDLKRNKEESKMFLNKIPSKSIIVELKENLTLGIGISQVEATKEILIISGEETENELVFNLEKKLREIYDEKQVYIERLDKLDTYKFKIIISKEEKNNG